MPGLVLLLITAAILVVLVLTIVVVHDVTHPVRRSGAYAAVRGLPFDPGDVDMMFEAWTLDVQRSRLPVWEIELGGCEAGKRLTGVFVHGWGESRIDVLKDIEQWRGVIDRAVLYDLRGHGDASPGSSRLGHREDDDVLALLERLDDEARFVLIGHDLGANIAIAAASRESEVCRRITGVVAIVPYDDFQAKLRQHLRSREFPTWPMVSLVMMWLAIIGRPPLTMSDDVVNSMRCMFLRIDELDVEAIRDFFHKLK